MFDGGQDTCGETTTVQFAEALTDPTDPGFFADMSLAISFSISDLQRSEVDINGTRLTSAAGNADDGGIADGELITAGGVGDSNANPADPFSTNVALDDELYDLTSFLMEGDTSFDIFTMNDSNDDNIFFLGLHVAAEVIPEPSSLGLSSFGLLSLMLLRRRRR